MVFEIFLSPFRGEKQPQTREQEIEQERATALRLLNPLVYGGKLDKFRYQTSVMLRRDRSQPLPNIERFNKWVRTRNRRLAAQGLIRPLNLVGANLKHAELSGVDLSGTNLTDADFSRAWMANADLHHANFQGAGFEYAIMTGSKMHDAWGAAANFTCADIRKVNFRRTDLSNAIMNSVVAHGANFTDAKMDGIDLSGPEFSGAILREQKIFSGTMQLTGRQLHPRGHAA